MSTEPRDLLAALQASITAAKESRQQVAADTSTPEREQLSPETRATLDRGLAQSAAGEVVDLGSFAEYANAPTPERVTLTDEERNAIHHAGDIHHPDHCDCSACMVEAGFQEDDCCVELLDTFDAVEGILAAREQALREEIAGEIEARETFGKGSKDYAFGFAVARRTFARIARGGLR